MLGKTAKKAGIEKKVSSHIIRHSFATHLLERGADIREIQLLLGHTSIKSTQVYLNLSNKHLKKLYSSYHPLENELYFDVESREDKIIKGGLEAGIKLIKEK
jgi:site-specific recombinase XerD